MEGCGIRILGIAKQVAVIDKSCGDVGQGMYSGHACIILHNMMVQE